VGGDVPNETKVQVAAHAHKIFESSYCESLLYRVIVKHNDFDSEAFTKATGVKLEEERQRSVTCSPMNQASDYHLHVAWLLSKHFEMTVGFMKGSKEPAQDEREPYAEQFMEWMGQFIVEKKVEAEIHADFNYPTKKWNLRFLLPLKAAIGPRNSEAEIDGISFALPSRPQGIKKVWLTQEVKSIWIHLQAERVVDFKHFDAKVDIEKLGSVLNTVLEEKAQ
jgi:hypothetical protein